MLHGMAYFHTRRSTLKQEAATFFFKQIDEEKLGLQFLGLCPYRNGQLPMELLGYFRSFCHILVNYH